MSGNVGMDTKQGHPKSNEEYIREIENRLLPVVRLRGEDRKLTLAELMESNRIPAVSIAVMEGGRVAWAKAWGVLKAGGTASADTETLFQAASMSKVVTAFLVLQQVENGFLDLDRDVNTWLQAWKVPENELTRQQPVTLRRILCHNAGLTVHGFGRCKADEPPTILDILNGRPPAENGPVFVDTLPGTQERYSGGGTTVCQLLLEEISGKSFGELASEQIFEPLGMMRSTFADPLPVTLWPNTARGHLYDGTVADRWWYGCPSAAAGGLWTTPTEYAMLFLEISRAHAGNSGLLGVEFAREMLQRPGEGFFALGPRVKGSGESAWFNHGGFHEDFKSEAVMFVESGFGAVVMVNGGLTEMPCWEILNGIAAAYGWPGFLPAEKTSIDMPQHDLDRYIGEYRIVSGYEPGDRMSIWKEDGKLMGQMEPLPALQILFESSTELFSLANPYGMHVDFADNGKAAVLTVMEDQVPMIKAVRIEESSGT
jgi:CubicO group peptidase (beta-lactamase class C family)